MCKQLNSQQVLVPLPDKVAAAIITGSDESHSHNQPLQLHSWVRCVVWQHVVRVCRQAAPRLCIHRILIHHDVPVACDSYFLFVSII